MDPSNTSLILLIVSSIMAFSRCIAPVITLMNISTSANIGRPMRAISSISLAGAAVPSADRSNRPYDVNVTYDVSFFTSA